MTDGREPTPQVSVVIPTHGRPQLVRRAVTSAAASRGVNLEIVVVDDASPVPVSEALAGLDTGAVAVRIVRLSAQHGVAEARNRGIEVARGVHVAFLDDDDLWAPDKLARQLKAAAAAGVPWSHTASYCLDDDLQLRWMTRIDGGPTTAAALVAANVVGTPSSVVVRTSLLREIGGFDPEYSVLADWDYWLRLAARADGLAIDMPLIAYVTHDESMHRQHLRPMLNEFKELRQKHRAEGRLRSFQLWRWTVDTARDRGHRWWPALGYLMIGIRWRHPRTLAAAARAVLRPTPATVQPSSVPLPVWVTSWQDTRVSGMVVPVRSDTQTAPVECDSSPPG